jgi:glycosyltransferase involved in cell wall biosynthesis
MRIGIVAVTKNESHIKIAKNLVRVMNAEICKSYFCDVDALISVDSVMPYLPYHVMAKLRGTISAAFIHDIRSISHTYLTARDAGRRPLEQKLRRLLSLNLIRPFLDIVLSPTNAIATTICEYTGIKPCVVYLGVDHKIYKPMKVTKQRNYKTILTVATKPHIVKGAIAVFRKLRTKAKLLIRGPCPIRTENIVCIPKVPEEDLPRLYASADILFYPSLHEGFGLVPLEAAACGTPIVAFEEPALMEVLGDTALFIRPKSLDEVAEMVDWVLNDEGLLNELSIKGINRAREFTWERTAKMLYTCIEGFAQL